MNEIIEVEKKENEKKGIKFIKGSFKNILINKIAELSYNYNFGKPFAPEDLEVVLQSSSEISKISNICFSININNKKFCPERDYESNVKKYKKIEETFSRDIFDEYYGKTNNFQNVCINLEPRLKKGSIIDLTKYEFYTYNNELKNLQEYKMSSTFMDNENEMILFIFYDPASKPGQIGINDNDKLIKEILKTQSILEFYKEIYVIYQIKNSHFINNENFKSKINLEDLNNNKTKVKYLFFLSERPKDTEESKKIINIFNTHKEKEKDPVFFFILESKNKIKEIKKIQELSVVTNLLKNKRKTDDEENSQLIEEFFTFLKNLNQLKYYFHVSYNISFEVAVSPSLDNIELKNIISGKIKAEFRTKEHKFLRYLESKTNGKIKMDLNEIKTIDIDIDFSDMKCSICNKDIPDDKELYYCFICKKKYCVECVIDNFNKKQGKEKFIDQQHNVIYFKTRDKNRFLNLDLHKIGKNAFANSTDDHDFSNRHSASCNGCHSDFRNSMRYICITCRPGIKRSGGFHDYCQTCINHMSSDDEEGRRIQNESGEDFCLSDNFLREHIVHTEHRHNNCIYMMVALEYKSEYYDF